MPQTLPFDHLIGAQNGAGGDVTRQIDLPWRQTIELRPLFNVQLPETVAIRTLGPTFVRRLLGPLSSDRNKKVKQELTWQENVQSRPYTNIFSKLVSV